MILLYQDNMSMVVSLQKLVYELSCTLYYVILFIGVLNLLPIIIKLLKNIYASFIKKNINHLQRYGKDSWVLVTGSSQGIGKQIALQFGKIGFNIILLARTQSKLLKVKDQLSKINPNIKIQIIICDLIQLGKKQNIQQILPQLNKYHISIIVNNAGIDVLDHYTNLDHQTILNLININCFALTALNYKFIPIFQKQIKQGKKRAIINVSSVAGELPLALHNVYSASKKYVNHLTKNLSLQYQQIDWLILRPSEVSTAMTCYKKLDIFTVTPQQSASTTINDLGKIKQTNGPISHKIQSFIYSLLPYELFNILWTKFFAPQFMKQRKQFINKQKSK